MDRDVSTNTVMLWIIGGVALGCTIVTILACVFLAFMFLGINPVSPFLYESF